MSSAKMAAILMAAILVGLDLTTTHVLQDIIAVGGHFVADILSRGKWVKTNKIDSDDVYAYDPIMSFAEHIRIWPKCPTI